MNAEYNNKLYLHTQILIFEVNFIKKELQESGDCDNQLTVSSSYHDYRYNINADTMLLDTSRRELELII